MLCLIVLFKLTPDVDAVIKEHMKEEKKMGAWGTEEVVRIKTAEHLQIKRTKSPFYDVKGDQIVSMTLMNPFLTLRQQAVQKGGAKVMRAPLHWASLMDIFATAKENQAEGLNHLLHMSSKKIDTILPHIYNCTHFLEDFVRNVLLKVIEDRFNTVISKPKNLEIWKAVSVI